MGWLKGRPVAQVVFGLVCGAVVLIMARRVFSLDIENFDFLRNFVNPLVFIPVFAGCVLGAIILAACSWFFFKFIENGLHILFPAAAHRFRALAMAFGCAYGAETIFHSLLYILSTSDMGSHVFVIMYAGKNLEFLYGFLSGPWFYILALGVVYPLAETHCHETGGYVKATNLALVQNGLKPLCQNQEDPDE